MRTVNDPYGGYSPLVDKMIGNAYEVVKHVAMNLMYVRHVSANLEQVYTVATNINAVAAKLDNIDTIATKVDTLQSQKVVTGTAAAVSASTSIAMGTAATTVKGVTVKVTGSNGSVYFPGAGTFTYSLSGSNLTVVTDAAAPATLVGGTIEALIQYTPAS